MKGMIPISLVLQKINTSHTETGQTPFRMKYRKKDGSIGRKLKCVRNHKAHNSGKVTGKKGYHYNLKENASIVFRDLVADTAFTKEYFLIIEFNGQKVWHE